MLREERLWKISQRLGQERRVLASQLADEFGLTVPTIRLDLAELEKRGLARRVYGGAVLPEADRASPPGSPGDNCTADRSGLHQAEKDAIAHHAASLVENGETLMVDGGSTTLQVCCQLSRRQNLTIVSCAVNQLWQNLASQPGLDVFLTGGYYRAESQCLVGEVAENMLRGFRATKAILGIDGVSLEHGLTALNFMEASVKKQMIQNSQELIIVADHSKFGKVGLIPVAPLERAAKIVTDAGTPAELVDRIQARGVEVIVAHPSPAGQ